MAGTCLGELGFWRVKSSKLVQVKHGDCTSILHLHLHALISPSSSSSFCAINSASLLSFPCIPVLSIYTGLILIHGLNQTGNYGPPWSLMYLIMTASLLSFTQVKRNEIGRLVSVINLLQRRRRRRWLQRRRRRRNLTASNGIGTNATRTNLNPSIGTRSIHL